jgi:monofunctional biosynthetic peptidoglycan transglycosylase
MVFMMILLLSNAITAQEGKEENIPQMQTLVLFDFSKSDKSWSNIDDTVMGGVSSSRMRVQEGSAVFEGEVSLENNGGFASVRSGRITRELSGYEGVRLRVKGDGKKYQFRIRTTTAYDGPSYQATFQAEKGAWVEIDLPFAGFAAAFRGRPLPDYPALDPEKIATMGFLIAEKQAGPFHLEIGWIKAYRIDDSVATEQ